MRRRRLPLVLLAGAVVVAVVLLAWPREREPEYEGRTLTEWVLLSNWRGSLGDSLPQAEEAEDAIRHIGTNALPWLLEWIQYQPGPLRKKLSAVAYKLPRAFGSVGSDRAADRAVGALTCLGVLGPQASPAIPELTRLMNDPKLPDISWRAAYALSKIGADALPLLAAVVNNPHASNRAVAALGIGNMRDLGTNASTAVAVLLRCLSDSDADVAMGSAMALGNLASEPDLVVPALVKALQDSRAKVRNKAAFAIGRFGDPARPAAPALLKALNDPVVQVRSAATNALRQIAPEVLP